MSRVELAKIRSLTFYKDAYTAARRTSALPQLSCIGKPCRLYQPEVVRCVNLGGAGTDIDWKCEADLPGSLRFGKVEVSCEGWSKPGDPYVLKGSCALEYRLVQIPDGLRKSDDPLFNPSKSYDVATIIFWVVWLSVLAFILYSFYQSCFRGNNATRAAPRTSNAGPRPGGNSGGWFPGDHRDDYNPPPPPYTKNPTPTSGWESWRPGFWTGAAVGGLANNLWNRNTETERVARRSIWDWERERVPFASNSIFGARRAPTVAYSEDDRGEGTSNLGTMRRSTGLGGTNVR